MSIPGRAGSVYVETLIGRLTLDGRRICISHDGRDVSADELLASIYRYARALSLLGVGLGDLVAFFAPNCPKALAIRYAAHLTGAGTTYLSSPTAPAARAQLIAAIDPKLIVVFPETAHLLPSGVAAAVAGVGMIPTGGVCLDELAERQNSEPFSCQARGDDLAVIVSSGGSTGVPKGSWRTFANYTAMVSVPSLADRRQLINGRLAYLSQVLADTTLLGGGAIVLKDHYEAAETLETIAKEQITDLFLVEPQLFDLMDHADLAATDLSSLRTITHLGASAPPSLRSRARQKFGTRIVHAYGASEEGLVSVIAGRDVSLVTSDQAFSAGRILPHVDVRVRRTDGSAAAMGECGTIEVRSPAMAQGYRNRPDLEMTAFHDGWYRSGDFGRIDADNYLYILGRAVDIVFVDGRLISPTLIEDTLCRLPEVRYASVVVEHEEPRWIAVAVAFPDRQIDFDNCRRAVLADHGETVAAAFVLLVRGFVPLTPQGKPDREAIRSLGRELSA